MATLLAGTRAASFVAVWTCTQAAITKKSGINANRFISRPSCNTG
jgi:hypothetical protein